jgi:hypothetical protein
LKLESHQQIQLSRVLQELYPFVIPILKPQGRFHPKQNTVNGVIIKYRFNLLFKSSSESVRRIISSFIGILLSFKSFKYPSTLNLPTLKLSTDDSKAMFLHPKSISRCVEFKAESQNHQQLPYRTQYHPQS